jgi:hypothetical protein
MQRIDSPLHVPTAPEEARSFRGDLGHVGKGSWVAGCEPRHRNFDGMDRNTRGAREPAARGFRRTLGQFACQYQRRCGRRRTQILATQRGLNGVTPLRGAIVGLWERVKGGD